MPSQPPLSITPGRGSEAQGVVYRGMDGRAFRARLKEVAASLPFPSRQLNPTYIPPPPNPYPYMPPLTVFIPPPGT